MPCCPLSARSATMNRRLRKRTHGPGCSTATGRTLDPSRWNVGLANLLAVSLPMLARRVFTVWGARLGALGLAAALIASRIWNPNPILPVGLAILMLAASLGLMIAATARPIRPAGRLHPAAS